MKQVMQDVEEGAMSWPKEITPLFLAALGVARRIPVVTVKPEEGFMAPLQLTEVTHFFHVVFHRLTPAHGSDSFPPCLFHGPTPAHEALT